LKQTIERHYILLHVNYICKLVNTSGKKDEIKKLLDSDKFDFIIFDTIDTFLIYNDKTTVYKFFRSIVNDFREKGKYCIFIGIKEALLEHMLHVSIETISDEVVDLVESSTEKFEKTFLKL